MKNQSLADRLTAARYTLVGQSLARVVCKATTEESIPPKKKHLDKLVHFTNDPNASIPELDNLLLERMQLNNWVIIFKALITVHHLMCYGHERFIQYLASNSCSLNLSTFAERLGDRGGEFSTFILRYSKYINEKSLSYRKLAFDVCRLKGSGKVAENIMVSMSTEQLLKTIVTFQNQLDVLLEFDCTPGDMLNSIMITCFMYQFRDLIKVFSCYNDGIINCLERYFDMNRRHCKESLDIYKKFLVRMDKVAEYFKISETIGVDKGEIPDLTKAPCSLLDALEEHLSALEGGKASPTESEKIKTLSSITSPVSIGVKALAGSFPEFNEDNFEEMARKALEEEALAMKQLKSHHLKMQNTTDEQERDPFCPSSSKPQDTALMDPFTPSSCSEVNMSASLNSPDCTFDPKTLRQNVPILAVSPFMSNDFNALINPIPLGTVTGQAPTHFFAAFGNLNSGTETFSDVLQPEPICSNISSCVKEEDKSKSTLPKATDLDSTLANLVENLDLSQSKSVRDFEKQKWQHKGPMKMPREDRGPIPVQGTSGLGQPFNVSTGVTWMPFQQNSQGFGKNVFEAHLCTTETVPRLFSSDPSKSAFHGGSPSVCPTIQFKQVTTKSDMCMFPQNGAVSRLHQTSSHAFSVKDPFNGV